MLAVMVAVPMEAPVAVTLDPVVELSVATAEEEDQLMVAPPAFVVLAVKVSLPPFVIVRLEGVMLMVGVTTEYVTVFVDVL